MSLKEQTKEAVKAAVEGFFDPLRILIFQVTPFWLDCFVMIFGLLLSLFTLGITLEDELANRVAEFVSVTYLVFCYTVALRYLIHLRREIRDLKQAQKVIEA